VLIQERQGIYHALICDFGLAGWIMVTPSSKHSSQAAGNWRWMSPEMMSPTEFGLPEDDNRCTVAADVYSYGILSWEVGRVV
jgi:serine/threonine protein kinase